MAISEPSERALRRAALRAYETGRLKGALARGAGALALAAPGFLACGRTPLAAACLAGFPLCGVPGPLPGGGYGERGTSRPKRGWPARWC